MKQCSEKTMLLLFFCNHFDMSSDGPDVFMYISKCGVREEMLGSYKTRIFSIYTNVIDAKQPTTRINAYECILYMCV